MKILRVLTHLTASNLRDSLVSTFMRFPLPASFVVLLFAQVATLIALDPSGATKDVLGEAMLTTVLMALLSVAVYLYFEVNAISKLWRIFADVGVLIFGLCFYYTVAQSLFASFNTELLLYTVMTIFGIVMAISAVPFITALLHRESGQEGFYIFNFRLVLAIIMSAIVGAVVMLLGSIAWAAISTLFDIHINDVYAYWGNFSMVLLAPIFFLTLMPRVVLQSAELKRELSVIRDIKFYAFIIKYIALPAVIFYFFILYSYSVKVLLNFSTWPHGEVAWMVISFSVFGYLVYVASCAFEGEYKLARVFRKALPLVVLPQLAMLFYAIGLRIAQYDVTMNRYLVVAFGLWLLSVSLYFIFSKEKQLGVLPLSLFIFTLLISFGPWSVYNYPEVRQLSRLKANLTEAGMLTQEGEVLSAEARKEQGEPAPSTELSREIYSGIEYLCQTHGCDSLQGIFSKQMQSWDADNYTTVNKLAEYLGVQEYREPMRGEVFKRFENKSYSYSVVHVSGYDYLVDLNFAPPALLGGPKPRGQVGLYSASIDLSKEELRVYKEGRLAEVFDLSEMMREIKSGDSTALTQELAGKSMNVRLEFSEVSLPAGEVLADSKGGYASGRVLIKLK